jgi:hypothetical protein
MNLKVILIGGLVFYVVLFAVSLGTGMVVHENLLMEAYRAHPEFWRPELNQDPPDMAALMPLWITCGLIASFVTAFIYDWVRPALSGPGWQQGLKFGVIAMLFHGIYILNWSGVFNLVNKIWLWWWLESIVYLLIAGAALGWVVQKIAPAKG